MARVLYFSFGYEPYWSGGMVHNQLGLMKQLKLLGHKVTYFTACRYDFHYKPYLQRKSVNEIDTVEIVNSPSIYDPYCYCIDPRNHCFNRDIEELTEQVVGLIKPDIVHISDLRMHSASVISLLRAKGLPVIKTMHNYWDLCPKGDLMIDDEKLCEDYDYGNNCIKCLSRYKINRIPFLHRIKGTIPYKQLYPLLKKMNGLKFYVVNRQPQSRSINTQFPSQAYVERRNYFVEMLNKCNLIHVSSSNVAGRLTQYNIDKERIKVIPLSVEGLDTIKSKKDYFPHYPIVFGYRGEIHARKGILTLLNAFSSLNQDKSKLVIYGDGDRKLLAGYVGRGLNIEYRGSYHRSRINDVLNEIDVGIVPSIWAEIFGIVGLEYINARIPIIASNIGGISEWLDNEINGYLFEPGNVNDLTAIMDRFVQNPQLIDQIQNKIRPWKNMQVYVKQINELYKTCGIKL